MAMDDLLAAGAQCGQRLGQFIHPFDFVAGRFHFVCDPPLRASAGSRAGIYTRETATWQIIKVLNLRVNLTVKLRPMVRKASQPDWASIGMIILFCRGANKAGRSCANKSGIMLGDYCPWIVVA
jgi:hypothetical protein